MPFLLMLCLSLACLPIEWPAPRPVASPWLSLAGTLLLTAAVVAGPWRIAAKTCRLLADHQTPPKACALVGAARNMLCC